MLFETTTERVRLLPESLGGALETLRSLFMLCVMRDIPCPLFPQASLNYADSINEERFQV